MTNLESRKDTLPRKLMHRKDMQMQIICNFFGFQDLQMVNHIAPQTDKHNQTQWIIV